jgi:small subunit ribosomal protein S16
MVRIRLSRVGSTKQAAYRVIVIDREAPRDGRALENLGFYNPRTQPATLEIAEDRAFHWMSKGAQPSESVLQLFKTIGLQDRYERFKKGEALETLMAEAKAAEEARRASPKTSFVPAPKKTKSE